VTNTVTLLADHKGFTKPKVLGDEYVSLANVAISSYRTGTTATAASQTITAASGGKTYTRTAGSYLTDGFVVGDHVVVEGSAANNNDDVIKISALTATVLTTAQAVAANSGGGDEKFTHAGEKILASSLGLNTISSIELVGQSNHDCHYIIGDISADGTFFYLYAYTTGSAALLSASLQSGNLGTVKLKATGNL
tara:strand:- start:286 stop:867 length:582 start_codon:yes stop_codon:yes gene_type:complete